MLKISINKKSYKVKTDWDEITWNDAVRIIEREVPKNVQEKMKIGVVEFADWLIMDDILYARDVLMMLSDIPQDLKENINPPDCLYIFMKHHLRIVADLYSAFPATYTPRFIEWVDFKDKRYFMPDSLMIETDIVPMHKEKSVNFVEAANMYVEYAKLKEKGLKHLNYFTAVYLREEGEGYDEDRIKERADLFKELTMDVYWEVFFCIHLLSNRRVSDTLQYLNKNLRVKRVLWGLRDGSMRLRRLVSSIFYRQKN
jgi:hypothetical protein